MASKTTSCKNCVVMRALDKPKACNIDCQTCSSSANRANDVGCLMLKRLDVPPRLDPYDTCDPPGGVTRSSRKEPGGPASFGRHHHTTQASCLMW